MKTVDIMMPYFKQGDDFADHLKSANGNVLAAFEEYYHQMCACAGTVDEILGILKKHKKLLKTCDVEAGGHCFMLSGDDEIINALIKEDLACEIDFEEEEMEPPKIPMTIKQITRENKSNN